MGKSKFARRREWQNALNRRLKPRFELPNEKRRCNRKSKRKLRQSVHPSKKISPADLSIEKSIEAQFELVADNLQFSTSRTVPTLTIEELIPSYAYESFFFSIQILNAPKYMLFESQGMVYLG